MTDIREIGYYRSAYVVLSETESSEDAIHRVCGKIYESEIQESQQDVIIWNCILKALHELIDLDAGNKPIH